APPHQPTGPGTDQSPLPPQPSPSPQRPPSRKRGRVALLIVALVATLSAGSVLYILTRGGGDHRAGSEDGSVPTAFLGTWTAVDNDSGTGTLSLTIKQGDVGDTVLSLVADGPKKNGDGTYHCVFKGDLADASGSDGPVHIDATDPVVAEPSSSCAPGKPTTLTLLPNDTLRRLVDHTERSLTYTRK
ncbi:serine/threonine protein kinase, partial [Streptomyces sp. AC154]